MSRLTTRERKALRPSQFAIPPTKTHPGEYPVEDKAHARDALSRVSANGTPHEKAVVRKAVREHFPGMKVSK